CATTSALEFCSGIFCYVAYGLDSW
nr:immunoglobulin heavy chain junction region [Macaca mulatta]MOV39327.1 immunoglobulin heavy chain junction region [Macaca mulatta]MOV39734.1 immunoglobulin heavy chain junction region [Macaca mulatta]MOV40435.1 immunoglobulin heavy chain junction region [Macaca mulatta]MOV41062.1 immunoglobulin heavy chain junction region [Macaca mulatta]